MTNDPGALQSLRWGIERETHRILGDGKLSRAPHPAALAPPSFTMDFAESQLELVTSPQPSLTAVLRELEGLTRAASAAVAPDLLWPFSIPPALPAAGEIRLARPGTGRAARDAERYRSGLALRYGEARQMICGIHVNVSLGPDLLAHLERSAPLTREEAKERSAGDAYYLRLVRNVVEDLALLVALFGASPVLGDAGPAFSFRNSPLGYARSEYRPFFDLSSIAAHAEGIGRGLRAESATFRKRGLVVDGRAIQLNGKVFQKEKEFYAPVRFRSLPTAGESAVAALRRRGVAYLELRFFDVDPFSPSGVSADALALLHLLLLEALSRVSVPRTVAEYGAILARADEAALTDPFAPTSGVPLAAAISGRLAGLDPFAAALDAAPQAASGPASPEAVAAVHPAASGPASPGVAASGPASPEAVAAAHPAASGRGRYGRALEKYRASAAEGRLSTSARLYAAFRDSGLSWTEFGTRVAETNAKGGFDER